MKHFNIIICAALCTALSSCFKEEPLNAECDIEQAYVHEDDPSRLFFAAGDTLVNVPSDVSAVTFRVKADADMTSLAPMFRITEGATISPESGSVHDFSGGQAVTYTVTSQDGNWSRTYNVAFTTYNPISDFSFENYKLVDGANGGQYYVWSDLNPDGSEAGNWATGNPGFNLSSSSAKPEEYPSTVLDEGYEGKGVKLTTRSTGAFGALVNMRIAAGNLFLGYFDVTKALTNTMQATNFGVPFDRKPLRLKGYYKYRPGTTYQDRNGNTVKDMTDKGDIYAVLYRNRDAQGNSVMLHGDDVKTNPNIVAIAEVGYTTATDEWMAFDVDFAYSGELDKELLANQGYNIAVVCTSSFEGASFRGAVGSTLMVDEITIEWE